jgi:hypothetical protein
MLPNSVSRCSTLDIGQSISRNTWRSSRRYILCYMAEALRYMGGGRLCHGSEKGKP